MQRLAQPRGFSQTSVRLSQLPDKRWKAEAVGHPEIPAVEHASRQVAVTQLTTAIEASEQAGSYAEPTGW